MFRQPTSIGITVISGTLKNTHAPDVMIQWTLPRRSPRLEINTGALIAAKSRPPIVYRVKTIIIVDIHVIGQPNLMLVASAFHLLRLGLGPCEGRQQQASQDRNNRYYNQ